MKLPLARFIVGKFLFLLVIILMFVLISSVLEEGARQTRWFYGALLAGIVCCIYAVGRNSVIFALAIIVGLCLAFSNMLSMYYGHPVNLVTAVYIFAFLFCMIIAIGVLIEVMTIYEINLDKIYAATSVYLLFGIAWGFLFMVIESQIPGSFIFATTGSEIEGPLLHKLPQITYYSFVVLSTLGLGDIIPVNMTAKSLTCVEAILGQLYLALMISRLVGIYVARVSKKIALVDEQTSNSE